MVFYGDTKISTLDAPSPRAVDMGKSFRIVIWHMRSVLPGTYCTPLAPDLSYPDRTGARARLENKGAKLAPKIVAPPNFSA